MEGAEAQALLVGLPILTGTIVYPTMSQPDKHLFLISGRIASPVTSWRSRMEFLFSGRRAHMAELPASKNTKLKRRRAS